MESVSKEVKPRPFVKWAGGKRHFIDVLKDKMPKSFNKYHEPFVGGGALLFALMPVKGIISDANSELINAYCVIRDNVQDLIRHLRSHQNTEEYFYSIRRLDVTTLTRVQRASRFIYLNRTCYNGLHRENSKGVFNTPYGRHVNPNFIQKDNLLAVSQYLKKLKRSIFCQDYKNVLQNAQEGDFVYFDPPYHPSSSTSHFTKYVKTGFSESDQIELAEVFAELVSRGVMVMLSNSNTKLINSLYGSYRIEKVEAARVINCKAGRRRKCLNEVIVRSW